MMREIERVVTHALVGALAGDLDAADVDLDADVFDRYGLYSLRAIPFLLELQEVLDVELDPEVLDDPGHHTVRGLAAHLEGMARPAASPSGVR